MLVDSGDMADAVVRWRRRNAGPNSQILLPGGVHSFACLRNLAQAVNGAVRGSGRLSLIYQRVLAERIAGALLLIPAARHQGTRSLVLFLQQHRLRARAALPLCCRSSAFLSPVVSVRGVFDGIQPCLNDVLPSWFSINFTFGVWPELGEPPVSLLQSQPLCEIFF